MELGTAAQTCLNLFGFSVLADVINKGYDSHSFLGCRIAYATHDEFHKVCDERGAQSTDDMYRIFVQADKSGERLVGDDQVDQELIERLGTKELYGKDMAFFKYFRTFAKPTGLGYPGGLSPKTFVAFAKMTYGMEVSLEVAEELYEIWLNTYPEFVRYFKYIKTKTIDPDGESYDHPDAEYSNKYFMYETPLGMVRRRTTFCAAANGMALQSPSAEGALTGFCEVSRRCYDVEYAKRKNSNLLGNFWPNLFVHDEIIGDLVVESDELSRKVCEEIQYCMVTSMETVATPDVKAGAGAELMIHWSKAAEWTEDKAGQLIPFDWDQEKGNFYKEYV